MPTYGYICEKCGQEFEHVQSISAAPLSVCPKERCKKKTWGKGKVKRTIGGGAGLLFKGTGFYITDYRSDKYKEAARKDSSSGNGSNNAATTPATKTPSKTTPATGGKSKGKT